MSLHSFFTRCGERTLSSTDNTDATSQSDAEQSTDLPVMETSVEDGLPIVLSRSKKNSKRQMRLSCKLSNQVSGSDGSVVLEAVPPSSDGPDVPENDYETSRKRRRTTRKPTQIYPVEVADPTELAMALGLRPRKPKQESNGNPLEGWGSLRPLGSRKQKTVTINYKSDSKYGPLIGERIEDILSGKVVNKPVATILSPSPPASLKTQKPPHPFFSLTKKTSGSPTKDAISLSSHASSTRSPSHLRRPSITPVRPIILQDTSGPNLPIPFVYHRDSKIFRHPGMREPPFPVQYQTHVRPNEAVYKVCQFCAHSIPRRSHPTPNMRVLSVDNVLNKWAKRTDIHQVEPFHLRTLAREYIRAPERRIISGDEVQQLLLPSLVHQHNFFSNNADISCRSHLRTLFHSIKTNLSAYDREECERLSWTKKYAPYSSEEILQPQPEIDTLRSWLQSMVIQTVDSSVSSIRNSKKVGKDAEKSKKKKRKTDDDLDGFLVLEDEEGLLLEELSDPEIDPLRWGDMLCQRSRAQQPPRRRKKKSPRQIQNSILISGPRGCGKTAAVYAAAKELGFEVFEINSGTRRSGKDILDRIGNMVENHLVQRVSKTLKAGLRENEDEDMGEGLKVPPPPPAVTMMSFFKSKPASTSQLQPPAPREETPAEELGSQKQSLILFEEVDVLFEEDKQFWETVRNLALYSKRPIVMTCSDEDDVPLDSLDLHAILRFRAQPVDLAVDYMLIISALEGHIIDRAAAASLYKMKGHDLRASITELDFWCQMGVGDRLGGLEWFFQRWPPGSDIDALGRKQRVISVGTYQTGMGWVSRDLIKAKEKGVGHTGEDVLRDVWHHWRPDLHSLCMCLAKPRSKKTKRKSKQMGFSDVALAAELESDADLLACYGMPEALSQRLDHSLSDPSEAARANHPLGTQFLAAEFEGEHSSLGRDIALYTALSRRACRPSPVDKYSYPIPADSSMTDDLSAMLLDQRQNQSSLSHPPASVATSSPALHSRFLDRSDFEALDCLAEQPAFWSNSKAVTISSFDREFSVITLDLAPFVRSIVRFEQGRRNAKSAAFLSSVPSFPMAPSGGGSSKWLSITSSRPAAINSDGLLGSRTASDSVSLLPHTSSPAENSSPSGLQNPTPPAASSSLEDVDGETAANPSEGQSLSSVAGTSRTRTSRVSRSALEGIPRSALRRENWFPRELNFQAVLATGGATWVESPQRSFSSSPSLSFST